MPIVLSQSSNPDNFDARNFMFVPIQTPEAPAGFWGLIILSGVALIDFQGQGSDWLRDTVTLDLTEDLNNAVGRAPYQPKPGNQFVFQDHQSVPFATLTLVSITLSHALTAVTGARPTRSTKLAAEFWRSMLLCETRDPIYCGSGITIACTADSERSRF